MAEGTAEPKSERLMSLDAYRGLIMIALAFNGFGLAQTAKNFLKETPDDPFWQKVQFHFSHVEWVGGGFWDFIQPSFMFMVGVSMAFSYLHRESRGHRWERMLGHAMLRSLVLIFLGIFLISNGRATTNWSLMNVLTQIGLGYVFLFLMWKRHWAIQVAAIAACLGITWILYTTYPAYPMDPKDGYPMADVTGAWVREHHEGIPAVWQKHVNVGHAIDVKLLNWLPRDKRFEFDRGGYQTINFLPSLATMLIGLICGEVLRQRILFSTKLFGLIVIGGVSLGLGLYLESLGCPIVKRIWTPSWALYSSGICCWILAVLFVVIDGLRLRRWSFPLLVVGMNSIAIYVMGQLLRPWTSGMLSTHFGKGLFTLYGFADVRYQPTIEACLVGLCFWLACWWMYRHRIFIRI